MVAKNFYEVESLKRNCDKVECGSCNLCDVEPEVPQEEVERSTVSLKSLHEFFTKPFANLEIEGF